MNQPGNTDEYNFGPNTDQFMAYVYAYKQQIEQISKLINSTPQKELVQDYGKIKNIELQIADVIDNLENLSGNPLGRRFNKGAVLKHLNTARVELNIASTLAGAPDTQTQILCFERIVKCRDYLNRAKDLIPARGG